MEKCAPERSRALTAGCTQILRHTSFVRPPAPCGTGDATEDRMKKPHVRIPLDPLGVKTGLELAAGGLAAVLLMRWLGM